MRVIDLSQVVVEAELLCIVVCYALVTCRYARTIWMNGCGLALNVLRLFVSCVRIIKGFKGFFWQGSGAECQVEVHKRAVRVEIARAFCGIASVVILVYLPMSHFIADDRQHIVPRRVHEAWCGVIFAIVAVSPRLSTSRLLHVSYALIAFSNVVTLSPLLQTASSVATLQGHIIFDCAALSLLDLYLPANLIFATVSYLTAALTFLVGNSSGSTAIDPYTLEDCLYGWFSVTMWLLVVNAALSKAVVVRLEGDSFRNELRAAKSILAGTCDAVVELDAELRLAQPSPKLAALLMLSPQRVAGEASMSSFLATEADREKFSQEVTSSTTHDEFCKAFHVSMKDNRGISVPVEAFCVRFNGIGDKEWFLLGFREFVDTVSPRRDQFVSPGLPSAALTIDVQSRLQSQEDQSTERSNSEDGSGLTSAVPELAIWFDVVTPAFTMLCCTSALKMLAGSSWAQICKVEQSLLRCIQPAMREDFEYWVRFCVDKSDNSASQGEAAPLEVASVRFRFSEHHHRFHLAIESSVTLVLAPQDREDWPAGLGETSRVVKIVLERPKWIQGVHWTSTNVHTPLPNDISVLAGAPESDGSLAPLGRSARSLVGRRGRSARSRRSEGSADSRRSGDSGEQRFGPGGHGATGQGGPGRSAGGCAGSGHGGQAGARNILAL
ncbi:unnamed protein product [Prorocentrum cordatum]|uniref:Uncharacterized protein n=1 Tax=Prorocentrum cordatum TaxID=2364126 RepID=A0ABN9VPC8_9DINO|nr:unnamed protein product [Polarella glacialis]